MHALLIGLTALSVGLGTPTPKLADTETPSVEVPTSEVVDSGDTSVTDTTSGDTTSVDTNSTNTESVNTESVTPSTSGETSSAEGFDFGKWLQTVFTPEVVASILSVITAMGAIIKLVSTMKELAKQNKLSDEHILSIINDTISTSFKSTRSDLIEPLSNDLNKILPVLDKFAKIMALSQENTPESRTAILNLISEIGAEQSDVKKTAEDAKKVVESQVKEEEAKTEAKKETLNEITSSYDGTSI